MMRKKEDIIGRGMHAVVLEDAVAILTRYTQPIQEKECVSLREACGRILAEDITAGFDQPPFPRSPLDGYAVRAVDTAGASKDNPAKFRVITEVDAGQYYEGKVGEGEAVRIMTGAPIPEGADAVVGQEDTDFGEEDVSVYCEFSPYQNYCHQGEDYKKGHVLLGDRDYIGPVETGIIASTGKKEVEVYRRPKALLISTGDEVTEPGQELGRGKIYDSNLYTLYSQLVQWGVEMEDAMHLSDDGSAIAERIEQSIDDVDIVVTSGGVSVGKKDILHDVYDVLDVDRLVHDVRIKPGKAMLSGIYKNKLVISLSGNPFAAYAGMNMIVRPVIAALNGSDRPAVQRMKAVLGEDYTKKSPTRRYVRANVEGGMAHIEGHTGGNGDVYSGRRTNALVEIEAGSGTLAAGDVVDVIML